MQCARTELDVGEWDLAEAALSYPEVREEALGVLSGLGEVVPRPNPANLSPRTVDHHVAAIMRKLNGRTRGEAVAAAARLGLTSRAS